jgi:hypothetical protein
MELLRLTDGSALIPRHDCQTSIAATPFLDAPMAVSKLSARITFRGKSSYVSMAGYDARPQYLQVWKYCGRVSYTAIVPTQIDDAVERKALRYL